VELYYIIDQNVYIKGTFELEVIAPKEWVAVANDAALKATPLDDGRVSHLFKATPPLSTYLYALVVGMHSFLLFPLLLQILSLFTQERPRFMGCRLY
jgi:hypothetical protein